MVSEKEEISHLIGEKVVLDTATSFMYVGELKEWRENFVVLENVDVHDTSQGQSNKELYALEARRYGIQNNRREVTVRKAIVVSISRMDDVIMF